MVSIARKNLFHDRGKLIITLAGLVAAITMVLFAVGMFAGTLDESVYLIDSTRADIWLLQVGNTEVLNPSLIGSDVTGLLKSLGGVADTSRIAYANVLVEGKDNRKSGAILVGLDPQAERFYPSNLDPDIVRRITEKDAVIVDGSIEKKLGDLTPGDNVTISGRSLEVVGICQGAKWFVSPYVFASFDTARDLLRLTPEESNFALVALRPGTGATEVAREIDATGGVDALPRNVIRRNTRNWMTFQSGMGIGIGSMVLVGLVVAGIIVALTIYTATIERIPEFGTLKALGASRRYIYRIMLEQVAWSVTLGFAGGAAVAFAVKAVITRGTTLPIHISIWAVIGTYCTTLALSVLGAMLSIRRVNRVDPAIVFRT